MPTGEPIPLHQGLRGVPRARAARRARACSCRAIRRSSSPSRRSGGCATRKQPVHVDLATRRRHDRARRRGRGAEGRGVRRPTCRPTRCKLARKNARHARARARGSAPATCSAGSRAPAGHGRRHHAAPAVRARATSSTTCPTRSATGSPSHTLTDHSNDGLGLVRPHGRRGARRGSEPNGWLLMETDPDRARDVKRGDARRAGSATCRARRAESSRSRG